MHLLLITLGLATYEKRRTLVNSIGTWEVARIGSPPFLYISVGWGLVLREKDVLEAVVAVDGVDLEASLGVARLGVTDLLLSVDVHCEGALGKGNDRLPCAVGAVELAVEGLHSEIILVADVEVVVGQVLEIRLVESGAREEVFAHDIIDSLGHVPLLDGPGIDLHQVGFSTLVVDDDLGLGESLPGPAHDGESLLLVKGLESLALDLTDEFIVWLSQVDTLEIDVGVHLGSVFPRSDTPGAVFDVDGLFLGGGVGDAREEGDDGGCGQDDVLFHFIVVLVVLSDAKLRLKKTVF